MWRILAEFVERLHAVRGRSADFTFQNIGRSLILAGRGEMDLVLTVDGQQANTVRVSIK